MRLENGQTKHPLPRESPLVIFNSTNSNSSLPIDSVPKRQAVDFGSGRQSWPGGHAEDLTGELIIHEKWFPLTNSEALLDFNFQTFELPHFKIFRSIFRIPVKILHPASCGGSTWTIDPERKNFWIILGACLIGPYGSSSSMAPYRADNYQYYTTWLKSYKSDFVQFSFFENFAWNSRNSGSQLGHKIMIKF